MLDNRSNETTTRAVLAGVVARFSQWGSNGGTEPSSPHPTDFGRWNISPARCARGLQERPLENVVDMANGLTAQMRQSRGRRHQFPSFVSKLVQHVRRRSLVLFVRPLVFHVDDNSHDDLILPLLHTRTSLPDRRRCPLRTPARTVLHGTFHAEMSACLIFQGCFVWNRRLHQRSVKHLDIEGLTRHRRQLFFKPSVAVDAL
jgi:hypothetical protein